MESITNYINIAVSFLQDFGIIGGFLLILLESIIPVLPLGIFIGFNNLAFGPTQSFIISWIATIMGCMISFALFRTVFKGLFYRMFKGKTQDKVEKFMEKISDIDFNGLVVLLALPFTPAFVINIAAGLSHISWKKYLVAIVISKISIIYFWGYIGTNLLESFKDPIILLKIFLIVLAVYLISKIIEKIIKE